MRTVATTKGYNVVLTLIYISVSVKIPLAGVNYYRNGTISIFHKDTTEE